MNAQNSTNFKFGDIVFFGRGLHEYCLMFNLDPDMLVGQSILDCPAGPAAFAREARERGLEVVACDPLFSQDIGSLREIVDRHSAAVAEKQARNPTLFHKELVPTYVRRKSMELFLEDFDHGKSRGQYVSALLPVLPFADLSFDLVLSGNLLFLYSDIASGGMLENSPLDFEFHCASIAEMMRVCRQELRIYPLLGPSVKEHVYLKPIMAKCAEWGYSAIVEAVPQRDIIGAESMLRICR